MVLIEFRIPLPLEVEEFHMCVPVLCVSCIVCAVPPRPPSRGAPALRHRRSAR
jgi:hypothetical protein